MMIIGFIGFGKVSANLLRLIRSDDISFVTSAEKRSPETIENIRKSDIEVLDTIKDVVLQADILISANSPKSAVEVAKEYGKYSKGIYLDLNNISPDTALEISELTSGFVKGAIIGKIDSDNPVVYVSGSRADELLFLNEFFCVKKISDDVCDAAILKLLRSSYTKTLSAVLIESYEIAKSNDLEDEFWDILSLTEGEDFKEKSLSRIKNTLKNSKRKSEELEELISYFDENELIMAKAALEKISR